MGKKEASLCVELVLEEESLSLFLRLTDAAFLEGEEIKHETPLKSVWKGEE